MSKRSTAAPALPTAAPNIPCWNLKPKRNTAKLEARERQKKMRVLFAPLRAALERAARH
jgi:hypothetical protein